MCCSEVSSQVSVVDVYTADACSIVTRMFVLLPTPNHFCSRPNRSLRNTQHTPPSPGTTHTVAGVMLRMLLLHAPFKQHKQTMTQQQRHQQRHVATSLLKLRMLVVLLQPQAKTMCQLLLVLTQTTFIQVHLRQQLQQLQLQLQQQQPMGTHLAVWRNQVVLSPV